jgi:hypothetical protein
MTVVQLASLVVRTTAPYYSGLGEKVTPMNPSGLRLSNPPGPPMIFAGGVTTVQVPIWLPGYVCQVIGGLSRVDRARRGRLTR